MVKKKLAAILAVFLLLVIGSYMLKPNWLPVNLTKVRNYRHANEGESLCNDIDAKCGICFGRLINKACYVNKSKLSGYELGAMGLTKN